MPPGMLLGYNVFWTGDGLDGLSLVQRCAIAKEAKIAKIAIVILVAFLAGFFTHYGISPTTRPEPTYTAYGVYVGDMHIHTTYSDGRGTPIEVITEARRQRLDFIAITDHHTIAGAIEARDVSEGSPLVIVGQEVTTPWGHVLAYGLTETVAEDLGPEETIALIHAQDAVAFAAHPWSKWSVKDITAIGLDGYEIVNKGNLWPEIPSWVDQYPWVGNSDAHDSSDIGMVRMYVFATALTQEAILEAILGGKCVITYGEVFIGREALVAQ